MQSLLHNVAEYLTPVLNTSHFLDRGVLTPEEFVAAGDQLVHWCPTWTWEAGDADKTRTYLPADKQFIMTRNVPCHRRVAALESDYAAETELEAGEGDEEGEETWLATHTVSSGGGDGGAGGEGKLAESDDDIEVISGNPLAGGYVRQDTEESEPEVVEGEALMLGNVVIDEAYAGGADTPPAPPQRQTSEDEYEDWDAYEEPGLEEADEAALPATTYLTAEEPEDDIVRTRTYDLTITYDKYYQSPRVWLVGYSEAGEPLDPDEVFQDVMQDYANRTVTIEPHPHLGTPCAAIHPCKHAATMKRISDNLSANGKVPRSDQALFLFLKFIQSVVPTIDYDHTMRMEAS